MATLYRSVRRNGQILRLIYFFRMSSRSTWTKNFINYLEFTLTTAVFFQYFYGLTS
jgi:hypothetical protein